MVEDKAFAKFYARAEARNICRIIKASTPLHIVTPGSEKIKLANPSNLSAYLEYCGGNATSYKDALSAVVVQR